MDISYVNQREIYQQRVDVLGFQNVVVFAQLNAIVIVY
jgi:hypothetical protein